MADGKPARPAAEIAIENGAWAPEDALERLVDRAIEAVGATLELPPADTVGLLFTGDAEIQVLNARFRGKDKPTNVLSFPAPTPVAPGIPRHLGDIALAYETVAREAEAEGKAFDHHLTHLVIHGFLHLLGYDHETPDEAEEMEGLERDILEGLAIKDPYA